MYTEYVNANPVLATDDKKGLEKREYQDNIKDILLADNDIESLSAFIKKKQNELKELKANELVDNSKQKIFNQVKWYLKNFVSIDNYTAHRFLFMVLLMQTDKIATMLNYYTNIMGTIANIANLYLYTQLLLTFVPDILLFQELFFEIKKWKSAVALLEKEIPFLEEELEIKKEEVEKLRANKTKNIEPTNEVVSLKEQNKEREKLWDQRIALVELYYENQARFQQHYKKGTLGTLLEDYSSAEQETLKRLLEKANENQ